MRLLHFTDADDPDSGREYVVFVDDGDSTPTEDFQRRGFKLYAEGEIDLPRQFAALPLGDVLMRDA